MLLLWIFAYGDVLLECGQNIWLEGEAKLISHALQLLACRAP
jgi:hypothetical protein